MAKRDEEVFDAFVRIWSVWWSGVPTRLARQESSLVVRLLTLGLGEGGVSQSGLKRQLGIAQPRLSKLMWKLEKVGWIQVKASKTDRRIRLITTTVKAQDRMAPLKQDLAALLQPERRHAARKPRMSAIRRRIERLPKLGGFKFEELESDGDGSQRK